jgi:hypothetical protein
MSIYRKIIMKTPGFSFAPFASLTALALLPLGAIAADERTVIPAFPASQSASVLSKQVQDYDTHLRQAQADAEKEADLALAKFDVGMDMRDAADGGHVAKANALLKKYKALDVQVVRQDGVIEAQMEQALGLHRAIVASPFYAGHYAETTQALSHLEGSDFLDSIGAGRLKFLKPVP